jgi:hypothetical protein
MPPSFGVGNCSWRPGHERDRGNWIQTDPKKGFFPILRLYSPLEPFFAKTWRPSEVEVPMTKTQ